MTLNINTIVQDADTFGAQARALLVPRGTAHWQTYPTAGTQHAVPGQPGISRELTEGSAHPAGRAAQTGQVRQFAVSHHAAFRHLRQGQVERRAAHLGGALRGFGGLGHFVYIRLNLSVCL
jgi:hypothetical protein